MKIHVPGEFEYFYGRIQVIQQENCLREPMASLEGVENFEEHALLLQWPREWQR